MKELLAAVNWTIVTIAFLYVLALIFIPIPIVLFGNILFVVFTALIGAFVIEPMNR